MCVIIGLTEQKSAKTLDNENQQLKDSILTLERKLQEYCTRLRKLDEDNVKLKDDKKLLTLQNINCDSGSFEERDKLLNRVKELEDYCEELLQQLTKWSRLDSQSQLIINKVEEIQSTYRTNENNQQNRSKIFIQ